MGDRNDELQTTLRLVREAQDGSRESLEELFRRYAPRARQIAALRFGWTRKTFQDYEDVAQEALLRAFRGLHRFDASPEASSVGSFRNWLARCIESAIKDHLRRRGARKRGGGREVRFRDLGTDSLSTAVFPADSPSPSDLARASELEARIERALLGLTERYRDIIVLRQLCGLSYGEIAGEMGFNDEENVRLVFHRALKKLKLVRARQETPVRREVALKLLRFGPSDRDAVVRFRLECQALAMMSHPCIAKLHDAGMTESGAPYYVAELVAGSRYCDERRLDIEKRIELFSLVCEAVHHAHLRGFIHRDLKPANVLVTEHHGNAPTPRVIDFGLAKAIGSSLGEDATRTLSGHFLGTPIYMSPEQARGRPEEIDVRTDVYALGVLLHELVAGTTPIDPGEICRSSSESVAPRTGWATAPGTWSPAAARTLAGSFASCKGIRGESRAKRSRKIPPIVIRARGSWPSTSGVTSVTSPWRQPARGSSTG